MTYQKLGEKGTKPMVKDLAQLSLPVQRQIQKTPKNTSFLENIIFG